MYNVQVLTWRWREEPEIIDQPGWRRKSYGLALSGIPTAERVSLKEESCMPPHPSLPEDTGTHMLATPTATSRNIAAMRDSNPVGRERYQEEEVAQPS